MRKLTVLLVVLIAALASVRAAASTTRSTGSTPQLGSEYTRAADIATAAIAHHRALDEAAAHELAVRAASERQRASRAAAAQSRRFVPPPALTEPSAGGSCDRPSTCPALRQCENGDAVGGVYAPGKSPGFFGAYQFDVPTWKSNAVAGGSWGSATPEQQDAAADHAFAQRGSAPWPKCGRHLK